MTGSSYLGRKLTPLEVEIHKTLAQRAQVGKKRSMIPNRHKRVEAAERKRLDDLYGAKGKLA